MKLKLISTTRDSYTVYLDNTTIGTVRRIHATGGSETQWKAEAIGWVYNKFGFNTKTEAAEALERAYWRKEVIKQMKWEVITIEKTIKRLRQRKAWLERKQRLEEEG